MSKTKIPLKKRIHIFNRDGNKCLWCGRSVVDGIKLNVEDSKIKKLIEIYDMLTVEELGKHLETEKIELVA